MKKQGYKSRYRLAQELGYENVSAIYQIEKGKAGMRAARLMHLMQLAGKLALLLAMAAPAVFSSSDAQAETSASGLTFLTIIRTG